MNKRIVFSVATMAMVIAGGGIAATIDFRVSTWSMAFDVEGAASSGGLAGTLIDFDRGPGLDNEKKITSFEAGIDFWGRHRLFGAMWDVEYGGENLLDRTINFSGRQYRVSSSINSKITLDFSQVGYQFKIIS